MRGRTIAACVVVGLAWTAGASLGAEPQTIPAGATTKVPVSASKILATCTPPGEFHPNPTKWTINPPSVTVVGPSGKPGAGSLISVTVPANHSPFQAITISWSGNTKCSSYNGSMTLKVTPKPKPATSRACATAQLAQVSATSSADTTKDLAKLTFLLQTGYTVAEIKALLQLLQQIGSALPSSVDLVSHVASHADGAKRAGEQGAWTKPTGTAAQQAADAQRQVDEVLRSPKREILEYTPTQGPNKGKRVIEVSIPASQEKPKGKALRFVLGQGKAKFTLGVPKAPKFAKLRPRVSVFPLAGFTLLVAGGTATWSLTSAAVAGVNQALCNAEKKKAGAGG